MKTHSQLIAVGTRLTVDGSLHEVVAFAGEMVTLEGPGRHRSVWSVRGLLRDPSVSVLDMTGDVSPPDPIGDLFAGLSETQITELLNREGHVLEVLTGYRELEPDISRPG